MNNHQRGVYQPLMDNIPIYDLSDEEIEEEERSRLPLLIVIALVVLASFAGVVWLAYNQGVARGRASAAVVIAAPEGPVRTAPPMPAERRLPIRVSKSIISRCRRTRKHNPPPWRRPRRAALFPMFRQVRLCRRRPQKRRPSG